MQMLMSDEQIIAIRRMIAEGGSPRDRRFDLSPLRTRAEVFG